MTLPDDVEFLDDDVIVIIDEPDWLLEPIPVRVAPPVKEAASEKKYMK